MNDRIFFDYKKLKNGNYFHFLGDQNQKIQTSEGLSYELDEWIGRGGNAAVFRCIEIVTDDEYAIKFLLNLSNKNIKRFDREIELFNKIKEDHITKYHGTGHVNVICNERKTHHRIPFIVMELAEYNLQQLMCDKSKEFSYDQYAGQFHGLAKALASLHECAVHRDIKPENILVADDRWLLSDYGLCTFVDSEEELTREGEIIGPKFWLSPEAQNRRLGCGDEINYASDIFQLAAIFWYVVTGRYPSGVVTRNDWRGPEKLFDLLHKSLLHDYTKRPQRGDEFLKYLEDALNL